MLALLTTTNLSSKEAREKSLWSISVMSHIKLSYTHPNNIEIPLSLSSYIVLLQAVRPNSFIIYQIGVIPHCAVLPCELFASSGWALDREGGMGDGAGNGCREGGKNKVVRHSYKLLSKRSLT